MMFGSVHSESEGGVVLIRAVLVCCLLSLPAWAEDYELQATVKTPDIAFSSETDIGLWARFHFAIHTSDFDGTREFYRRLGFTDGISGFPLTNTHAMARALGMFDLCQYELEKGEVLLFPGRRTRRALTCSSGAFHSTPSHRMGHPIIWGWPMRHS